MTYHPRHSIIGVEIDGCEFTTDTELLPWVTKQTDEGTERYQPCVVHGVKINGVWFDACAMGDDFIEEMEYEIQRMPLNAEGDIDEAAIRMGKAEMAKRAAEAAQPTPAQPLTEEQIVMDAIMMMPANVASDCTKACEYGIRYAERHHGITGAAPAQQAERAPSVGAEGLPELPESTWHPKSWERAFSADQMRAYAIAALAARQPAQGEGERVRPEAERDE